MVLKTRNAVGGFGRGREELSSAAERKLPKVSIVIPTYNEEKNIGTCLNAVLTQEYPRDLVEIIVVDNGSEDNTVPIVEGYIGANRNIRLLFNRAVKDSEVSKMVGLRSASGDLFLYLDADIEVIGSSWLTDLIMPLVENPGLAGSFPRFAPKPTDTAIGRYLRYHPLELDPVFQFFCTEIDDTVIEDKESYRVCEFHPPKVPPIGICVYRTQVLRKLIGDQDKFMDIDVPVILSNNGFNRFAHIPSAGIYHINVQVIGGLLKRRIRNLHQTYLPNVGKREFVYFDLARKKDFLKICFWVLYANLFVPLLVNGIYKTIKYRDIACMYEPVVAISLTDLVIWTLAKTWLRHGRLNFTQTPKLSTLSSVSSPP